LLWAFRDADEIQASSSRSPILHLAPHHPLFDINLLGYFPVAVLAEHNRWVAAIVDIKPEPRITLTYPMLASSRNVAFVVAGKTNETSRRDFAKAKKACPLHMSTL